jgi:hypothetical protein
VCAASLPWLLCAPWAQGGPLNVACVDPPGNVSTPVLPLGAEPTPGQGCLYGGSQQVSVTRSQQNFVITVPSAGGDSLYVYTGDRYVVAESCVSPAHGGA